MDTRSSGTLSFLFSDLEGSTRLWEQYPEQMKVALVRHDAILRSAIEGGGGRVVKTTGDGMMAVFDNAADAVTASVAAQRGLVGEAWGETGPLRVRMGIHAGQADERAGDFFGPTVNRTARLMAAGHGGQVLLSAAAGALVQDALPAGVSLLDLGEHRLKDLGRPEHVFQLLAPDLRASFPPLATLRQATADLPARVADLIGRDDELLKIKALLADPAIRLLTLTGPGGTGKTTLALRVAEDLESSYSDGAVFVDLSSATETSAVLVAIARAMGLDDVVERPLQDQLADGLRGRTMLLVLDNLEQVTEAAATLAQLLRECSGLTVLATSREALHVRAERVLQIPPLRLPPAFAGRVSASEVGGYESVLLFLDRARVVRPDFELTDANAAAVAEICRRLDGLPLAIELAAARLRLFSPEVLRDRLGDRLTLLRSGPRDLPARQQTLRGAMDWSYELLDPREQLLFELMGVFADTEIGAVEAVVERLGSVEGTDLDPIDGLASLVDKSLARQVEVPGGEPRVTMLETIREFARDRLDQRPALAARARRAHADYFADLGDGLRPELTGNRRQAALATLAEESANLRLAWAYWVAEADLGELNKLTGPLMTLDDDRGWYLDTVQLTTDMLAVLSNSESTPERIGQEIALRISLARALMATKGVTKEVEDAYSSALQLFERGADVGEQYAVLRGLASLYVFRAQLDLAANLGHEMLALGEREQDPRMLINGHLVVGTYLMSFTSPREGLDHLDAAISIFRESPLPARTMGVGNDPRVACYTTSAFALRLMGYPDRAIERARAALALAAEQEHPFTSAYARFHVGLVNLWLRDYQAAHDLAAELLEIAEEHGFRIWIAAGSCLLGAARVNLGQIDEGLAGARAGMALYQELRSPPVFWPFLLYVFSGASHQAGLSAEALERLEVAIGFMSAGPGSTMLPDLHLLKGDILASLAADAVPVGTEAETWYMRAYERAAEIDARGPLLRAATRLARLRIDDGDPTSARTVLRPVYETFSEGFATPDLIEAREVLARAGGE